MLFGSFIGLASVATFYPLSMVRVSSSESGVAILGESTGPNTPRVARETSAVGSVFSVSGRAYSGQNSYYDGVFRVKNNSDVSASYKLDVLKVYPFARPVKVMARVGESDTVTVAPGQSVPVGIFVESLEGVSGQPFDFTAKVSVTPLNFQ